MKRRAAAPSGRLNAYIQWCYPDWLRAFSRLCGRLTRYAGGLTAAHAAACGQDSPDRPWTNSKPNRPFTHRCPLVTSWSSGDVTFTILLSWTCSSRLQPTPQ